MKRSALQRRTPLKPVSKRPRHLRLAVDETGRDQWKSPVSGVCACGCGQWTMHLERHHVLHAQEIKRAGGRLYDLANSMLLHPDCHERHTNASRKLHIDRVPLSAIEFSLELIGVGRTEAYFARRYAS